MRFYYFFRIASRYIRESLLHLLRLCLLTSRTRVSSFKRSMIRVYYDDLQFTRKFSRNSETMPRALAANIMYYVCRANTVASSLEPTSGIIQAWNCAIRTSDAVLTSATRIARRTCEVARREITQREREKERELRKRRDRFRYNTSLLSSLFRGIETFSEIVQTLLSALYDKSNCGSRSPHRRVL